MIFGNCVQGKDLSAAFWAELGIDPDAPIQKITIIVEGPENPVKLEIEQFAYVGGRQVKVETTRSAYRTVAT